jgi:hypothetical protein
MVDQREDAEADYDRIAGGLQGCIIEMLEWLRENHYATLSFSRIARAWEIWARANGLTFDRDIPR